MGAGVRGYFVLRNFIEIREKTKTLLAALCERRPCLFLMRFCFLFTAD